MDESASYSLTQQSVRLSMHQATVCLVTRQLTRQGTRRAVLYKVSPYSLKGVQIHP